MKIYFRYDYKNKMSINCLLLSFTFLTLAVILYYNIAIFVMFLFFFILLFSTTLFLIIPQGFYLNVKKRKIYFVDDFYYSSYHLNEIRKINLKELSKKKGNNIKGFFIEYYHPSTYMVSCNYVYNNGKVYKIEIIMKNGAIHEKYFGWMYKEKSIKLRQRVEDKLKNTIESINRLIKDDNC